MTLQQQAYNRIDRMSEDGIRVVLDFMDRFEDVRLFNADEMDGISAFDEEKSDDFLNAIDLLTPERVAKMNKAEKKELFLHSGGKIDIDEDAVNMLREVSVI